MATTQQLIRALEQPQAGGASQLALTDTIRDVAGGAVDFFGDAAPIPFSGPVSDIAGDFIRPSDDEEDEMAADGMFPMPGTDEQFAPGMPGEQMPSIPGEQMPSIPGEQPDAMPGTQGLGQAGQLLAQVALMVAQNPKLWDTLKNLRARKKKQVNPSKALCQAKLAQQLDDDVREALEQALCNIGPIDLTERGEQVWLACKIADSGVYTRHAWKSQSQGCGC